jgi:signal transduction histidine kinase
VADPARSRADLLAAVSRFRPGPEGAELSGLCRVIAEGLGLRWCAIRLADDSGWFSWPGALPNEASGRSSRELPVLMGNAHAGVLAIEAAAVRGNRSGSREVLQDLVDALGPVLLAMGTQRQLAAQVAAGREHAERIAAARRQAFAQRDEERRVLERDLHDGAQHHLVAVRMAVGLLELQLGDGDLAGAAVSLQRLREQVAQTEQVLLSTAAGVCPPVLVDHGLVEALKAEFSSTSRLVEVVVGTNVADRRFPLAVETAVYFACLEAVNNAGKHAPEARVVVRLAATVQGLAFTITDDGPGLSQPSRPGSFGLDGMRARIAAAGGALTLTSGSRSGTRVEGFIPI